MMVQEERARARKHEERERQLKIRLENEQENERTYTPLARPYKIESLTIGYLELLRYDVSPILCGAGRKEAKLREAEMDKQLMTEYAVST